MNVKNKRLLKDTVVFGIGSLSSKVIMFFLVPLYTTYLTTDEYGVADLVVVISGLAMSLFSVDIHYALLRFALSGSEKKENVAKTSVVICSVGLIGLLITSPLLCLFSTVRMYVIYYLVLCAISIFRASGFDYLKVVDKNRVYSVVGVVEAVLLVSSNILLICVLDGGVEGYLISNIISYTICTIISIVVSGLLHDVRFGRFDRGLAKRMMKLSAPMVFSSFIWWVNTSFGRIMITVYLNTSALGIYTAALKIPVLINLVIGVFNQAWGLSSIREIEGEKDRTFFSNIFKWYSMLVIGSGILLVFIVKPVVFVFLGKDFRSAWRYVPVLLLGTVFYAIEVYYESLYLALKKTINSFMTSSIGAIVNIFFSILLLNYIGVWAAVVGYCVGFFVMATVRMCDMDRYLRLEFSRLRYWGGIIVMHIAVMAVTFDWHWIWICSASFCVYLLLYGREWVNVANGFGTWIRSR